MSDRDFTAAWPEGMGDGLAERSWVWDDFSSAEEYPAGGLTSLRFITAALRRRARFWCAMGLLGLLAACGFAVKYPPAHQASASVLLSLGPYENVTTAADNNLAIAKSRAVAGLALQKLGLQESAGTFLGSYSAVPVTDRVMTITASALSSDQAVLRANAVANAFLQFRAEKLQAEQKLLLASLNQQISQAQQRLDSINTQISQLSGQSASSAQQSQLVKLKAQRAQTSSLLPNLQQAVITAQTSTEPATAAAVRGSVVLDAAVPLKYSQKKSLLGNAAIGLVAGLALSMGIIVIQALVSDKLRRRDDVAQALGAPVRLSVGPIRLRRWLPGRSGQSATRSEIQRIAAHLGRAVPRKSPSVAALAVVPVDDLRVPALSVISLALSCAGEGKRVVVADLCSGAPAARLLGTGDAGVRTVTTRGASVVVAVPERDALQPPGPLGRQAAQASSSSFTEEVAAACASADLMLILVTLDPSLGGEHLATWAADAVAVVTAGRSSWARIQGIGEMIRLSGVHLVSAVLVGADKTDDSLGVARALEAVGES